jgi:uridine kinase
MWRQESVNGPANRASPRAQVLERVADAVLTLPDDRVRRVGIDGVDGAGKTVFADELAATLRARDVEVIRASGDGFHHPREIRYRRGRHSPEGFYLDSFDLTQLRGLLLDPLGPGGDRRYVRAVWDVARDAPVHSDVEVARDGQVLVLDGLFLHRPELVEVWDLSVFLRVGFATSVARLAHRDGSHPDPEHPANRRYVEGQRHYLATCAPASRARFVVDNTDPACPQILSRP